MPRTRPVFTFIFYVIWLASLSLSSIYIMLQTVLCLIAEVRLEVGDLKGRPIHESVVKGWKLTTYHSVCRQSS